MTENCFHIGGAAFAPPSAGAVASASKDAREIAGAATFVRLASVMGDALTAGEVHAVLTTLHRSCAGHSFRFTGRQADSLAGLLECMAAQVAAQDAGGRA